MSQLDLPHPCGLSLRLIQSIILLPRLFSLLRSSVRTPLFDSIHACQPVWTPLIGRIHKDITPSRFSILTVSIPLFNHLLVQLSLRWISRLLLLDESWTRKFFPLLVWEFWRLFFEPFWNFPILPVRLFAPLFKFFFTFLVILKVCIQLFKLLHQLPLVLIVFPFLYLCQAQFPLQSILLVQTQPVVFPDILFAQCRQIIKKTVSVVKFGLRQDFFRSAVSIRFLKHLVIGIEHRDEQDQPLGVRFPRFHLNKCVVDAKHSFSVETLVHALHVDCNRKFL